MSSSIIDYSTWRKGTITRLFNGRKTEWIEYCPVCGQKGSYRPPHTADNGAVWSATYTHQTKIDEVMGLQMRHILQECTHVLSFERLMSYAQMRYRKAIKSKTYLPGDSDWPAAYKETK